MPFDPLSWAAGFALTKAGTWALDRRNELRKKLRNAVVEWTAQLPAELHVLHPDAVFPEPSTVKDDEVDGFPALKELRDILKSDRVPSAVAWKNAIWERRAFIAGTAPSSELQPFFSGPDDVARERIQQLAETLHRICTQDEKLSRTSLYSKVEQIGQTIAADQADRRALNELQRRGPRIVGEGARDAVPTFGISDFLLSEWQSDRSRELDEIRERFRCGDVAKAHAGLRHFYESQGWVALPDKVRSIALRLFALIELERAGDVEAARKWLQNAREADPRGNFQVLEALIANWERGAEAGLTALGRPESVDAWNVNLLLRLATGDAEGVLRELGAKTFEPNAETVRIRALALLAQRDVAGADACAQESAMQHPEWAAMRHTLAITQYASTIAPEFALTMKRYLSCDQPQRHSSACYAKLQLLLRIDGSLKLGSSRRSRTIRKSNGKRSNSRRNCWSAIELITPRRSGQ